MKALRCLLAVAVIVLGVAVAGCCCIVGDKNGDQPEGAGQESAAAAPSQTQ